MNGASEYLAQFGVSFDEAKAFIYANLSSPELIYNTAAQYGVTYAMLAELYGQGVTEQQVKSFFISFGLSANTEVPGEEESVGDTLQEKSHQVATVSSVASLSSEHVDSVLADSNSWDQSVVTYGLPTSIPSTHSSEGSDTSVGWRSLTTEEQSILASVISSQNQFINTDVQQASPFLVADIQVAAVSQDANTEAFAYYPGSGIGGDIFLNANGGSDNEYYYQENGFGVHTLAHELGHAMGLKHTFEDGTTLPDDLDNLYYSIMTYTSVGNYEVKVEDTGSSYFTYTVDSYRSELGLIDVAALQVLYGADMSTNTGDTVYVYNEDERKFEGSDGHYITIWDAGGTDTLDLSDAEYSSYITMDDYSLSSVSQRTSLDEAIKASNDAGLGNQSVDFVKDFIDSLGEQAFLNKNNLAIAQGVVIENVITGQADDYISDNLVDNMIFTGAGDDVIYLGNGGYDTVDAGTGDDYVVLELTSQQVNSYQDDDGFHLIADDFSATLIGVEHIEYSDTTISIA